MPAVLLAVAALGVANLAALDGLDLLMGYERWIAKGMPARPF
jgi:hypothetical protein